MGRKGKRIPSCPPDPPPIPPGEPVQPVKVEGHHLVDQRFEKVEDSLIRIEQWLSEIRRYWKG